MKTEKIYVDYLGGESRNHIDSKGRISSANYMFVKTLVDGEEIEIYSEYVYPEITSDEDLDYDIDSHEWDGYDECKESFLWEASKYGFTANDFVFSGDTDCVSISKN